MNVQINVENEHPKGTGVRSTVQFNSPEFISGLNEMFEVQPTEKIVKVIINKGSITAFFRGKKEE